MKLKLITIAVVCLLTVNAIKIYGKDADEDKALAAI